MLCCAVCEAMRNDAHNGEFTPGLRSFWGSLTGAGLSLLFVDHGDIEVYTNDETLRGLGHPHRTVRHSHRRRKARYPTPPVWPPASLHARRLPFSVRPPTAGLLLPYDSLSLYTLLQPPDSGPFATGIFTNLPLLQIFLHTIPIFASRARSGASIVRQQRSFPPIFIPNHLPGTHILSG